MTQPSLYQSANASAAKLVDDLIVRLTGKADYIVGPVKIAHKTKHNASKAVLILPILISTSTISCDLELEVWSNRWCLLKLKGKDITATKINESSLIKTSVKVIDTIEGLKNSGSLDLHFPDGIYYFGSNEKSIRGNTFIKLEAKNEKIVSATKRQIFGDGTWNDTVIYGIGSEKTSCFKFFNAYVPFRSVDYNNTTWSELDENSKEITTLSKDVWVTKNADMVNDLIKAKINGKTIKG
jgi:hypothetical protein